MRYLWLCLSLIVLGCSNQSHIKPDLRQYVSEVTEENEPVFDAGHADLNGDGLNEALVFLKGMQWCGSGGCTFMIFENLGTSYQFISKSTVTSTPISVAKTESHGWKDLIVWSRGNGLVLMKFDGDKYPRNPSLEPPVSESKILESQLVLD